jgi:hypothetical protein
MGIVQGPNMACQSPINNAPGCVLHSPQQHSQLEATATTHLAAWCIRAAILSLLPLAAASAIMSAPVLCSSNTPSLLPLPQHTGTPNTVSAEQLEAHGAALCQRSVMTLFDNNASVKAALETGTEPQITCADWEMAGGWYVLKGSSSHAILGRGLAASIHMLCTCLCKGGGCTD